MTTRPIRIPEAYPLVQDPPFTLDGTRTLLFALPAIRSRLEAMLSRTFGWAAPDLEVQPIGSTVLLVLTDVVAARASDPNLGSFSYREATFFVPIVGTRGGVPFTAMHVPFIYPTEGLAVAAGREVYGLPKKPASIAFPTDPAFFSGASDIDVRTLSSAVFDGSPWQQRSIVSIHSDPQPLAVVLEDALLDAVDALFGPIPGGVTRLLKQDLVQLKQVADVAPGGLPARVLYRSITHLTAPIGAITNVRLADASKVRVAVANLASEPIREVLGLAPSIVPSLVAGMTMDFRFEAGETWLERPVLPNVPVPRTRVLILGGGVAAMAAAHALTDTDLRRAKYDVRILSEGHYLGGKGANVRNPALGERMEEHGLHVIFGFYHNFLRLFRSVYAEAARPPTVEPTTFDEAFRPEWKVIFSDGPDSYEVTFPRTPATYGAGPNTLSEQVEAAYSLVAALCTGGTLLNTIAGLCIPGSGNKIAREIFSFAASLLKGVLEDVVSGDKTWDDLDDLDFREWMKTHRIALLPDPTWSAIMQVPYDGVFAYEGPDQSKPVLSAGIAARGLLKLVTDYERAPYHVMTAGMGECVFMPLYEVLKARGVKFEMFTRIKEVRMDSGRVDQIVLGRQATVTAGRDAYDPVATVSGVRVWKRDPDLAQLSGPVPIAGKDPFSDAVHDQVGADEILTDGADFDWVICALPSNVTAHVLRNHAAHPVLSRIEDIPTVATLHLQAWTKRDVRALGWQWAGHVLGGFPQPLNSMLESHELLTRETWGASGPKGLLYASGPFGGGWSTDSADPAARATAESAAVSEATAFTKEKLGFAFDDAPRVANGDLDLDIFHAPLHPGDPMKDQFVRGNIDRSSRYVLMKPGTQRARPRPDAPGLTNVRLAGDWTKNGTDIPCQEGAVRSGLLAAQSILGEDLEILD
jgi:uncharacterized protein with NAD-binding domain and iron-sulfur cluster